MREMKQLRTKIDDLETLFTQAISVAYIAEGRHA